ncbi:MAG: ATP-binding protein [Anaerolineales bacterium]|nr:ATP-binding protein [Anaerolineales bacterium]
MAEQLKIHNFGPIREANITARDITVFVGPQATGKSLAAQVLYFFSGLESLIGFPSSAIASKRKSRFVGVREETVDYEDSTRDEVLSTFEWWLGNKLSVYAGRDAELLWNPDPIRKESAGRLTWLDNIPEINSSIHDRIGRLPGGAEQIYIPAGRTLFSLLPPATALRITSSSRSKLNWPGNLVLFYETLADALGELWRDQDKRQQSLLTTVNIIAFLKKRIDTIFKGEIRYGPDTISLQIGKDIELGSETLAAGQMELWPFWAIILANLQWGLKSQTVYFEEPEAHLHPKAQQNILEMIAYLANNKWRFVITTHSPYVLYAINNFLMANKVLSQRNSLPPGIPVEAALNPESVAAYRFSDDGIVHNIMDYDIGLIDEDELDSVADELGTTFSILQDWMESNE